MSWLDQHRLSEQNAIAAESCARAGDQMAVYYYGRAAGFERQALDTFLETENALTKVRSIGILAISVAALMMKAKQTELLTSFVEASSKTLPLTDAVRVELQKIVEQALEPAV